MEELKTVLTESVYNDLIEEIDNDEGMDTDDGSPQTRNTNACTPHDYEIGEELYSYTSATRLETDLAKIPSFFDHHQSALKTCILHQHVIGPVGKSSLRKEIAKYAVCVYPRLRVSTHG